LRRTIKLGGSLLDLPTLAADFQRWLDAQPPAANLLVVGGGAMVDALREVDRAHRLDQAALHRLCLDALELTARLAPLIFPGSRLVASLEAMPAEAPTGIYVLGGLAQLDQSARRRDPELPQGWDLTSDTLAALAARAWPADELVLLKSADAPSDTAASLADCGYLDRCFPRAWRGEPPARCVNLRHAAFPGVALRLSEGTINSRCDNERSSSRSGESSKPVWLPPPCGEGWGGG
jgi:aspartokinase-like uncharacterized kinase